MTWPTAFVSGGKKHCFSTVVDDVSLVMLDKKSIYELPLVVTWTDKFYLALEEPRRAVAYLI